MNKLVISTLLIASAVGAQNQSDDQKASQGQNYKTDLNIPNKAAHRQNVGVTSVDPDGQTTNQASTSGSGGASAGATSSGFTSTTGSGQGGD